MKNHYNFLTWILTLPVLIIYLTGCQTTPYYQIRGLFGAENRELMADSVRGIGDSLYDASDEFQAASMEANNILAIQNNQEKYDQLMGLYKDCKSEIETVKSRVQTMKEMSGEFFKEWRGEIRKISSESLKNESQKKYDQTYKKYSAFLENMAKTDAKLNESLGLIYDQAISVKHNPEDQSSEKSKADAAKIESNIKKLTSEIKDATKKTDKFASSIN